MKTTFAFASLVAASMVLAQTNILRLQGPTLDADDGAPGIKQPLDLKIEYQWTIGGQGADQTFDSSMLLKVKHTTCGQELALYDAVYTWICLKGQDEVGDELYGCFQYEFRSYDNGTEDVEGYTRTTLYSQTMPTVPQSALDGGHIPKFDADGNDTILCQDIID